jgi:hypothetical protein
MPGTTTPQPETDGVSFGRIGTPDPDPLDQPVDLAEYDQSVRELIGRAASLTPTQVRQLAAAADWQWLPLGIPSGGTVAGARAAALAAGRASGRLRAMTVAQLKARQSALESPGGRATQPGWSKAEVGLAALLIGVVGAVVSANIGSIVVSIGFAVLAVVGGVLLLFLESRYVRRLRLAMVVSAAVLATVTRDLIEPETHDLLAGPWRAVMRD